MDVAIVEHGVPPPANHARGRGFGLGKHGNGVAAHPSQHATRGIGIERDQAELTG